jgi:hypothetical protein
MNTLITYVVGTGELEQFDIGEQAFAPFVNLRHGLRVMTPNGPATGNQEIRS